MFDFNKLDDYKVAIDDGVFIVEQGEFAFCFYEGEYNIDLWNKERRLLSDKDWETFKKKVADYFLGVDEK